VRKKELLIRKVPGFGQLIGSLFPTLMAMLIAGLGGTVGLKGSLSVTQRRVQTTEGLDSFLGQNPMPVSYDFSEFKGKGLSCHKSEITISVHPGYCAFIEFPNTCNFCCIIISFC
jgi:hypothetical protein